MSFSVGHLWIGLINVLFNCTRSKHNLTFPLPLGTKQNCCTTLKFHQHLIGQYFAASVTVLALLSVAFVVHKLLFLVVLDVGGCHLLPARKIYI